MYDAVIIGAGLSGLAAGIRLAYYDQRVCILERHTTIGGLNSFYRLRGRNYDVGLHAVTNYAPRGTKKGPFARLVKQLRMSWDDFSLVPQNGSAVVFPHTTLRFDNNVELLESELRRHFPSQIDRFRRLRSEILDYDNITCPESKESARARVGEIITDPLLLEMLFCPLMFYGCAREKDMEFGQFCIMFRSIFLEGFGRPPTGIRPILKNLVRRFRDLGGELRLRSGVQRLEVKDGRVSRLILDDGQEVEGRHVLSSAGWVETMKLCPDSVPGEPRRPGRLSFCETSSTLDVQPRELNFERTIVFFNDSDQFHWQRPDSLCDTRSGVICSPNNFQYEEPLAEGSIRITCLANFDGWNTLDPESYRIRKLQWYDHMVASAVRFVPDFRHRVIDTDMFTPTTVVRYTGHENGAIYGAPQKQPDGLTPIENLFICGTDQGWVGIIGSIMSGISIANRHVLRP